MQYEQISNTNYRKKLFRTFFLLFLVFSIIILLILFNREKNKNIEIVRSKLGVYTEIISNYIGFNGIIEQNKLNELDSLVKDYFDTELRITLINSAGKVIYDTSVKSYSEMEDHSGRNEIKHAEINGVGTDLRISGSTGVEYFYYARKQNNIFIRTALPLTANIKHLLSVDRIFILFLLFIFIVLTFFLIYVSDHFGRSVQLLRKFSTAMASGEDISDVTEFRNNELGAISSQIKKVYQNLRSTQKKLSLEKEKFIQHLSISKEGIGIFSSDSVLLLSNKNFINYLDILTEGGFKNMFAEFKGCNVIDEFLKILKSNIKGEYTLDKEKNVIHSIVSKNQQIFDFYFLMFGDNSYEIIINDITEPENQKIIKQQLIANISHELKTPVTAVSGFLQTILLNKDIPEEKIKDYIQRSYNQISRLDTLISDISVLNKIDEVKKLYEIARVNLNELIAEVISDMDPELKKANMNISVSLKGDIKLKGNPSLLEAIFRNLIDNSIKYAGEGSGISIVKHFEDENYFYLKYSDDGKGIPEEHLARIFERFYRIDKGRSRALGGTGLGLSIVKNAVNFHNGEITAKALEQGIEFSFSLKKE